MYSKRRKTWNQSDYKIGGWPAIKLGTNENTEYTLSGPGGEIWENGPGQYKAVVFKKNGDEHVVRFGEDRLKYYIKKLRIPYRMSLQCKYTNNFGQHLDEAFLKLKVLKIND